jgi:sigma-B regulation protein RsbU (phosphoserine phosphatase)
LIRTLLVDDERPARDRLRQMLAALPEVEVVGEAADGVEAIERIAELRPDLIFLDIEMPGRTGLEVAASLRPPRPQIIFCTAFDQYAIRAFEHHAIDYLLKPVTRARLADAVGRVSIPLRERNRWTREIEDASRVQAGMFPAEQRPFGGLDYSGSCTQAIGIGGDYYDFIHLGGGTIGVALADVSGKGISAALLMAGLHARLQSLAPRCGAGVAGLLEELNRATFQPETQNRFVTLFYGHFDATDRVLTYANAGHCAPILFRPKKGAASPPGLPCERQLDVGESGSAVCLETGGTVLGVFPETGYQEAKLQLVGGDILVAYSDGVTETRGQRDEEFGEERVARLIALHYHLPAAELRDRILAEVSRFAAGAEPNDDMTLVVVRATWR